jgi:hypothetical protein
VKARFPGANLIWECLTKVKLCPPRASYAIEIKPARSFTPAS